MNWVTLIVAASIAGILAAIIAFGIRNKKKGKRSCGGSCGTCGACGACHAQK